MKFLFKTTLACIACFAIASCTKSINSSAPQEQISADNSGDVYGDCLTRWFGVYSSPSYANDTIKDKFFIANGIATLTGNPFPVPSYFTSIELTMPKCRWVYGDSTRLEVRLRNPADTIGSVSSYDVSLWLIGSKDSALVTFNGTDPQFTILRVGNNQISNSEALVYLFQDWTTLSLEAKDKHINVYKNGAPVLSFKYRREKLGKLRQIHIDFKGSGQVDWVKMYNSNTDQQLMQEDFNNAHSNVIWY
jgi:hypothetical protein